MENPEAVAEAQAGAPELMALQVIVPEGVGPGVEFIVTTPDDQNIQITCPDGVGPGDPVVFQYYPMASQEDVNNHPGGDLYAHAMAAIAAEQHQVDAVYPRAAAAEVEPNYEGFAYPPNRYQINQPAIVTRSSGEEAGCIITDVYLTALGPWYRVYLGDDENSGEPVFKQCDESDLQFYAEQ